MLTTGQRLPAERDECRAFVQRLAAHGVGALGFGVGVGHDAVPDAVARACVEFDLPLLVVPEPTPFVSVVRVGADYVAEAERRVLRRTVEFQRRLTRVALRDGAEAVVSAARTFLDRPVVVLTPDGAAIGEGPVTHDLLSLQAAGRLPQGRRVLSTDDVEVHPLIGQAHEHGWLATSSTPPLGPSERFALQHVVSCLSLPMETPQRLTQLRDDLGRALLHQLEDGRDSLAELTHFGLSPDSAVALVAHPTATVRPDDWRAQTERALADANAIHRLEGDSVVAVAPNPLALAESHVGHARLDGDAARALERARSAAQTARRRGVPVVDGEAALDVVLAQPSSSVPSTRGRGRCSSGSATTARESLRVTVTAFLRHGGSFDATARELKVHRHTVSSRVRGLRRRWGSTSRILTCAPTSGSPWRGERSDIRQSSGTLAPNGQRLSASRGRSGGRPTRRRRQPFRVVRGAIPDLDDVVLRLRVRRDVLNFRTAPKPAL